MLRLRDGVYTQQLLSDSGEAITEKFTPLAAGKTLDHIPFWFAGSDDNTPRCDAPMLLDIALMNISHYQSTAIIEEASYLLGCPTLHVDIGDLSPIEFAKANGDQIKVGARTAVQTKKGKIEMVQASESGLAANQAAEKIERMKELGAKLVTRGNGVQTAEAARINASGEASALDIAVNNLSDALEKALEDMARFDGQEVEVKYRLNTEYWESSLDPQTLSAITGLSDRAIISKSDARYMIRAKRVEIEEGRTDEEIEQAIAEEISGLPID